MFEGGPNQVLLKDRGPAIDWSFRQIVLERIVIITIILRGGKGSGCEGADDFVEAGAAGVSTTVFFTETCVELGHGDEPGGEGVRG